jgi:ribosomal protein L29
VAGQAQRFAGQVLGDAGELENTARLGAAKRDVARLLTVAKQRGIDVEKETKRI